ncbi:MAG TPA: DUF1761 domain-containing protein [Gemmatimonadaceae bacterium]|nr:DUF1761 domain-containing protein [Gemmatimonadaceae bacterium]
MLISWVGVLIAALAAAVLHLLWYSTTSFRFLWSKLPLLTDEVGGRLQATKWRVYLVTFLSYAIMAFFFAVLARVLGVDTVGEGVRLGSIIWLGFILPSSLTASMFAERSVSAFVIDVLFHLLYLSLIGAIIGALFSPAMVR